METSLLAFVAATYKTPLSSVAIAASGVGFTLLGRSLKRFARGAGRFVPFPFGLLIRMAIAAGTIEALGQGAILYFEKRT
jgi:hypothetical protein